METRTLTENGTPVSKEKTVAFSGHRTNRIAKFTADREKLFREVGWFRSIPCPFLNPIHCR